MILHYIIYIFNLLKPSGYYTYHLFNILKLCNVPTQCICVFRMVLIMELSPSWEAASRAATQEFPNIYERFITLFTRALHWFLSWVVSIQFITPHPVSLRSILILSSHLFLVVSFLPAFPPKSSTRSSSPHSCYMPHLSHPYPCA
jgi:hypothetical protein